MTVARRLLVPTSPRTPRFAALSCLFVFPLLSPPAASQGPGEYRFAREGVLGTSSSLVVNAPDEATAQRAEAVVFAEVARLQGVFSTWDKDAELAKLVAAGHGRPSAELTTVLELAANWRERSHGAFEPGVARLGALWRDAAASGVAPASAALTAAAAALRATPWQLHDGELTLRGPVTLDAIAKGHVVDRAATALAGVAGVSLVSFQIGGDTRLGVTAGPVAITDPRRPAENAPPLCLVQAGGRAVASSGGYARGFDVAGVHHSHILDPRTGNPCDGVLGASVVADDVATADVLATILCVLGAKDGFAWLATVPGADGVLVTADGTVHESPGFAARRAGVPTATKATSATPGGWPAGFALQVDFEIKAPAAAAGGRGRGGWKRPYVAVWIEDMTGAPAKTLCLWVENRRWLRDLRRWARENADQPELTDLVSQATRKAGAYTLTWDGTDDDGRALAAGKYFVCIEATREHGTYQLIRREIELHGEAQAIALEGGEEIATAKLTFGPAARSGK